MPMHPTHHAGIGLYPNHSYFRAFVLFALPSVPSLSRFLTGHSPIHPSRFSSKRKKDSVQLSSLNIFPESGRQNCSSFVFRQDIIGILTLILLTMSSLAICLTSWTLGWFKAKNCTSQILVSLKPNPVPDCGGTESVLNFCFCAFVPTLLIWMPVISLLSIQSLPILQGPLPS